MAEAGRKTNSLDWYVLKYVTCWKADKLTYLKFKHGQEQLCIYYASPSPRVCNSGKNGQNGWNIKINCF